MFTKVLIIDAHRLKVQGGSSSFCQNPLEEGEGGSRLSGYIARGSPYFEFYCIFINKFFENLPGVGCCFIPPYLHLWQWLRRLKYCNTVAIRFLQSLIKNINSKLKLVQVSKFLVCLLFKGIWPMIILDVFKKYILTLSLWFF